MFAFFELIFFLLIGMVFYKPISSYGTSYQFDPANKKEIKDPEMIRLRKKLNEMDGENEIH